MTGFVYPYRHYPVLRRYLTGKLSVSLPIRAGEGRTIRPWLHDELGPAVRLAFDAPTATWLVGRGHFVTVRDAIISRYGACQVETEAIVSTARQCDERCQAAEGPDCVCTCGGEFHGDLVTAHHWGRVGETTLVSRTATTRVHRRLYVRADVAPARPN